MTRPGPAPSTIITASRSERDRDLNLPEGLATPRPFRAVTTPPSNHCYLTALGVRRQAMAKFFLFIIALSIAILLAMSVYIISL